MTDVKIGDRSYPIQRFTAYKMLEASELVAGISEKVPDLSNQYGAFVQQYRESHRVTMPRAEAEHKYPVETANVSDAAWEAAGQSLVLSEDPDPKLVWASIFPKVFRLARTEVATLFALALCPNSELEDGDVGGKTVDEITEPYRKAVLHKAELGQLVDLGLAVFELLRDEFQVKRDQLGEAFASLLPKAAAPDPAPSKKATTPRSSGRGSSSGSRARSGGPAAKRSTGSRGQSSSGSGTS